MFLFGILDGYLLRKVRDEYDQAARLAAICNIDIRVVVRNLEEITQALAKVTEPVIEKLSDIVAVPDSPRPPAEIKKDIKYEKNPMRLKQLNRELNESYKVYKRK